MNTFHKAKIRSWLFRFVLAGLINVCLVNAAQALDPKRAIVDYVRDRWGAEQGFPGGPVYAIAQTADGYLWLGTEKGLVRFDGLNFRLFNATNSPALPPGPILDLITDSDGNLWIRPQSRNMLRYRDGTFSDVMPDLDSAHSGVSALCRGPNGEVLFAVRRTGVFTYKGDKFEKLLSTAERPNLLVISMAMTDDGKLWIGSRDAGLFYMTEGELSAITKGLPDQKINSLLSVEHGNLWIGTDNGVVGWASDGTTIAGVFDKLERVRTLAMARDGESNIWIGTSSGLLRLNTSGTSSLEEGDAGSAAAVNAIFEDRERNLWIGGTRGIERLRDTAFVTSPFAKSLADSNGAFYIGVDGRTWFAPSTGGLYWQNAGQIGSVNAGGLEKDVVFSLAGREGELWIGRMRGGLTQLRYKDDSFTAVTYTQSQGLVQNSIYAVHQSRDGTVWAGSISGGLSRFKDGKFTTYTLANGLASNTVTSILESSDGTMWFGTANGLSSLLHDKWASYGPMDGIPPGSVNCLFEDSSRAIWIGTDYGIAVIESGRIQVPREVPQSLREQILGIAEDSYGWLWISTSHHVLRVEPDKVLSGVVGEKDVREFDLADGLRSVEGVKRHRSVVVDATGRIWVSTNRALSVVDPRHVARYSLPAIVRIEDVIADGGPLGLQRAVRIPGTNQRITLSYSGLSLTVPERVRFRYRLDNFDKDWSETVATREAVYTNLSPGSYRFRVIASNSDGLWNGSESVFQFEVEPVFWQTLWFRTLLFMAIALTFLVFYRLRVRRLTAQMNIRFKERLAERTRIAQDLHDTLLQGFLSASMQLGVASDKLPADSPAKPLVTRVLDLMRQVIEEGRSALKGLRSYSSDSQDLAESLSGIQQELAIQEAVDYRIAVEGSPHPLHPLIGDEVYRICREALVNAFRHSRASTIELRLRYGSRQFRIVVRDNGDGIDHQVLRFGREGHWGLSGMRERAEAIGAKLKIWSMPGAGTEVILSIPADVAFESQSSPPRSWFGKFYPRTASAETKKIRNSRE
ncbi:MAG TPA: two-component regulator propeller domain-containing protein [Blastocatellia bacterium]|nr:two-component regulator propeller domain-containing protein [Blastocatellia bacterium]